jgi:hypothetical protein
MIVIIGSWPKHTLQNTATQPTHTAPTQYRRPATKEHDDHWELTPRSINRKILLFLIKHILLNTNVLTFTIKHMHVMHVKHFLASVGRFPTMVRTETCKSSIFIFKKTLLRLVEFNPNCYLYTTECSGWGQCHENMVQLVKENTHWGAWVLLRFQEPTDLRTPLKISRKQLSKMKTAIYLR